MKSALLLQQAACEKLVPSAISLCKSSVMVVTHRKKSDRRKFAGTLTTQLQLKGDDGHFASLLNILVWVSLPVTLPLTGWLLEKCGQAFTLAVAQTFCMAFLAAQVS